MTHFAIETDWSPSSQKAQTNNMTSVQKTAVNKSIWIIWMWTVKLVEWLQKFYHLLFNYSSRPGCDSRYDCWLATLCAKVKYVGHSFLMSQQWKDQFGTTHKILCSVFIATNLKSIKRCPRESNRNHIFSAKSKIPEKRSSSSFIWLSPESDHAPDTAAAEWNQNKSSQKVWNSENAK